MKFIFFQILLLIKFVSNCTYNDDDGQLRCYPPRYKRNQLIVCDAHENVHKSYNIELVWPTSFRLSDRKHKKYAIINDPDNKEIYLAHVGLVNLLRRNAEKLNEKFILHGLRLTNIYNECLLTDKKYKFNMQLIKNYDHGQLHAQLHDFWPALIGTSRDLWKEQWHKHGK